MDGDVAKARLGLADPKNPQQFKAGTDFAVHFNPTSLQYTVKNTLKEGSGKSKKQYISQTSGQLTLELVFDTTLTGGDVREDTVKVVNFLNPPKGSKAPPIVQFDWGTFMFRGMVENFKETIDFFAANGVPLRSSVSLGLSSQDKVFDTASAQKDRSSDVQVPRGAGLDPTNVAQRAGDPAAARGLAASNNQESLRFADGPLTVSGDVQLNGPVAFAAAGAGLGGSVGAGASAGFGAGAGAGFSAGAGAGAGAGFNAGASASAGVGFSAASGTGFTTGAGSSLSPRLTVSSGRSSASFGVAAVDGAFGGLHVQASAGRTLTLDPSQLLDDLPVPNLATDSGATFSLGGQAALTGSASLTADVGASASLRGSIQFDP